MDKFNRYDEHSFSLTTGGLQRAELLRSEDIDLTVLAFVRPCDSIVDSNSPVG